MTIFQILVDVEESAVGMFLRTINRLPGIANFHLDLDKVPARRGAAKNVTARPGKTNGAATEGEGSSGGRPSQRQIVIRELLSGPKNIQHLGAAVAAHGHSAGAVNSTLNNLRKVGVTESAGTGLHKLTAKALDEIKTHAPEDAVAALPAPEKRTRKSRGGPTVVQICLMTMAATGDRSGRLVMRDALPAHGIKPISIDGALAEMREKKWIKPTSEKGVYDLTAEGKKQAAKLQQPSTTEESAHG